LTAALVGWASAQPAEAGVLVGDLSQFPVGQAYYGDPATQVADYSDYEVTEIILGAFANPVWTPDGADEVLTVDVTLFGQVIEVGGFPIPPMPVILTGDLHLRVFGKAGQTTGSWAAEVEYAECIGAIGLDTGTLRESPTLDSMGRLTITDIGGGLYNIDSFFDIFTEVAPDGGGWTPDANGPHHMILPEPASAGLLLLGAAAMLKRRRKV